MDRLRTTLLNHRRAVAAVLAGLAVLATTSAVTAKPPGTAVIVSSHDLASGHVVTASDIETVHVPRDAVPGGRVSSELVVGRVVGGPMRSGEPFTDARIVDPRHLGTGKVLATAVVDASTVSLLRVGDRVDVMSLAEDSRVVLATAAVIVTIKNGGNDESATVGVATERSSAVRIARAALAGPVGIIPSSD